MVHNPDTFEFQSYQDYYQLKVKLLMVQRNDDDVDFLKDQI